MFIITQLSDLHFGSNDPGITLKLKEMLLALSPDLVVVSGDLTTRAREREYMEAREFLDSFPGEKIVVPGNHDISMYNVVRRFFKPLERFHRIIGPEEEAYYITEKIAVIGLNTSRSFTIKGGNISRKQIEHVKQILKGASAGAVKIAVTHHPVREMNDSIFFDLKLSGIEVIISGHMHRSHAKLQDGVLLVEAGTATSVRYREEPNSFNHLEVDEKSLNVQTYTWNAQEKGFVKIKEQKFIRSSYGLSLGN